MEEGVVRRLSVFEGHGADGAGVEPADEQSEGVDVHVREGYGLRGRLEERGCEGGAEVGRLRGQERSVQVEAYRFRTDEQFGDGAKVGCVRSELG